MDINTSENIEDGLDITGTFVDFTLTLQIYTRISQGMITRYHLF